MTGTENDARWATTVIEDAGADLLRYFARRTTLEDIYDLLNETLAVVWERRTVVPKELEEARMWTFGVARNTLRKYRRSHSKQNRITDALRSAVRLVPHSIYTIDPAEALEGLERHAEVRAAMDMLRERDRELIVLVHWDGFTLAQAAALLGMNPSTARTRYARAKERLATLLAQHRTSASPAHRPVVPNPQAQP